MKPRLLEDDIQRTFTEFLEWDGWRAIRTDPVSDRRRGKGFGEVGMPDYLFVRYWAGYRPSAVKDIAGAPDLLCEGQILWVEFKRPDAKPRADQKHQRDWHLAERKRGALVIVVDDIDEAIAWYDASGLRRRAAVRAQPVEKAWTR